VLPYVPTSYSVRALSGESLTGNLGACFVGLLNSFQYDWVIRQFVGGLHLQDNITKQSPVVDPRTFSAVCRWSRKTKLDVWVMHRVLELTYTAWDLEAFALDCGYDGPPFRWDEERR